LAAHGCRSLAVIPVGGGEGRLLVDMLTDLGVDLVKVPVGAAARCNITISEPDGTVTKVNSLGDPLSDVETEALFAAVRGCVPAATWFVAGGSLPRGVADSWYADLIDMLRPTGVPVAVDTSGAPLAIAVKAGPALVKPNRDELQTAVGRSLHTIGDVVDAADELRRAGAGTVLASLGRDGAVLVGRHGRWHGEAPAVARSTVGAGDAMLAGYLFAGADGPAALATALAWGAAAAALPGSQMPGADDLRGVRVCVHPDIDRSRRLGENF
ncbi:MAG TPA: hexose kinase, partial [Pseudonocardiaceae bacterium]|nr:hexose kinase [Pseudonocardiaceae bacterium]